MSFLDEMLNDPRALNNAGTSLDVGGQLIGAVSHLEYGMQARRAAEFQSAQLRQNAGQALASSQRAAISVDRSSQMVASAALATAAASGGGASDPGVVNLIAENAGEAAYRKQVVLYQGEDRAQAMGLAADAKDYEGKSTKVNQTLVAGAKAFASGGTLIKGEARDASLFQRFGGGGPKAAANEPWTTDSGE